MQKKIHLFSLSLLLLVVFSSFTFRPSGSAIDPFRCDIAAQNNTDQELTYISWAPAKSRAVSFSNIAPSSSTTGTTLDYDTSEEVTILIYYKKVPAGAIATVHAFGGIAAQVPINPGVNQIILPAPVITGGIVVYIDQP